MVSAIFAVTAVTTRKSQETIFNPSEAMIRKVWEIGRKGRFDWGESHMPGFYAAEAGGEKGVDEITVAWLSPVSYAYRQGWNWTKDPESFSFSTLNQVVDTLRNRMTFQVTLGAPLVMASDTRRDKTKATIDKATFTLIVGKDRINPSSIPALTFRSGTGEVNYEDSKLVNDGSWDRQGNRIDPVYETYYSSEKFYQWQGIGIVDFTGALPTSLTPEKLARSEVALEVSFRGKVRRLSFGLKDRKKSLKSINLGQ